MTTPLEAALQEREDLDVYGKAKRTLFALQLTLGLDDVHTVATSVLTDGPDDKSCDLIYVDRDSNTVVIAQGYEADATTTKQQAPGNKAASVHQAVNWVLGDHAEDAVPERLRSARKEVHEALGDGVVQTLEIWFVHNLPESVQNATELKSAATAAASTIKGRYPDAEVDVVATEIGLETLGDRYEGSQTPILITEEFDIPVSGAFTEAGENWTAVCTSLEGGWLRDQFTKHKERLFSANIRGYLGSTRSQNNINNGIQQTARTEPKQFWAYNNGITALVNGFDVADDGTQVTVRGLAIVNGAQTTGSLGSVADDSVKEGRVLARFIKCDDPSTVQEIIRFNNRQNPTQAADFRSNDRVQSRLVQEFHDLGVVGYNGGRRGGAEDVIRRPGANQILATVAAQALAAYHGAPDVAYHQKGQIWEADSTYSSVFPERTTARHIMLACALMRAVEEQKTALTSKATDTLSNDDKDLMAWFSLRGSTFLAVTAVGSVAESILNKTIGDLYDLKFKKSDITLHEAVAAWQPTVQAALALAPSQLTAPLNATGALRNKAALETAIAGFRGVFNATAAVNRPIYEALAGQLTLN